MITYPSTHGVFEEAIRTKEKHPGSEVTVLTIGPSDATKELRECLAKGADKAVILSLFPLQCLVLLSYCYQVHYQLLIG